MTIEKEPTIAIRISMLDTLGFSLQKEFKGCNTNGIYKETFNEAIDEAIKFLTSIKNNR